MRLEHLLHVRHHEGLRVPAFSRILTYCATSWRELNLILAIKKTYSNSTYDLVKPESPFAER
jgi:hypothetical protein